jgi:amidase
MPEGLTADLAYASATQLMDALVHRRISALEATDQAVARIEQRDGPINAVVVRDFDRARAAAQAADAAMARGDRRPLLGLPVTVKETHDVAGLPTTWGVEAFRDRIATEDTAAVARLTAAGAVILGKTNVPPFNADWQSRNPLHGRTNNPWDLDLTPGGSSGGSAASLAAGLAPLELASDIGGSIRVPAAFCGVYGHKPSYELIPVRGHAPPGMDDSVLGIATVGPMARTATDLDLALDALAGPDVDQAQGYRLVLPPARHKRIGAYRILLLDSHPRAAVDDEIRDSLHTLAERLAALGARVSLSSERLPDLAAAHDVYVGMISTAMSRGRPGVTKPTAYNGSTCLRPRRRSAGNGPPCSRCSTSCWPPSSGRWPFRT